MTVISRLALSRSRAFSSSVVVSSSIGFRKIPYAMRFPAFGAYIRLKIAATGSSFHEEEEEEEEDDDAFFASSSSLSSGKAPPPPRTKKSSRRRRRRREEEEAFGTGQEAVAPPTPARRKR